MVHTNFYATNKVAYRELCFSKRLAKPHSEPLTLSAAPMSLMYLKESSAYRLIVAFLLTKPVTVSDDDQAIACARESDVDSVRFGEEADRRGSGSIDRADTRFFALKAIENFHAEGLPFLLDLTLELDDCTAIEIELCRVSREDGDICGSEGGIFQQISYQTHDQNNATLVESRLRGVRARSSVNKVDKQHVAITLVGRLHSFSESERKRSLSHTNIINQETVVKGIQHQSTNPRDKAMLLGQYGKRVADVAEAAHQRN